MSARTAVFLSACRADQKAADRVAKRLNERYDLEVIRLAHDDPATDADAPEGYDSAYDAPSPAQLEHDARAAEAMAGTACFVLLLSKAAGQSKEVLAEVYAAAQFHATQKYPLLAMRLDGVDPSQFAFGPNMESIEVVNPGAVDLKEDPKKLFTRVQFEVKRAGGTVGRIKNQEPSREAGPAGDDEGPRPAGDGPGGRYDVFISYTSADRDACEYIIRRLIKDGKVPKSAIWCMGPGAIRSGTEWQTEVIRKLNAARCFVLLLSRESINSTHVKIETSAAIDRMDREGKLPSSDRQRLTMLTFRLDRVKIAGTSFQYSLSLTQRVNESVRRWKNDVPQLVTDVCGVLDIAPPPPVPWIVRLFRDVRDTGATAFGSAARFGGVMALGGLLAVGAGGYVVKLEWDKIEQRRIEEQKRKEKEEEDRKEKEEKDRKKREADDQLRTNARGHGLIVIQADRVAYRAANDRPVPADGSKPTILPRRELLDLVTDPTTTLPRSGAFDRDTVAETVRVYFEDLRKNRRVSDPRLSVVVSTGVRQGADPEAGVEQLVGRIRAGVGGHPVETTTARRESRCLILDYLRRAGQNGVRPAAGPVCVIEIGSDGVRAGHFRPATATAVEDVYPITEPIPGTVALRRAVQNVLPASNTRDDRMAFVAAAKRAATDLLADPLVEAKKAVNPLVSLDPVVLTGDAVREMCRDMPPARGGAVRLPVDAAASYLARLIDTDGPNGPDIWDALTTAVLIDAISTAFQLTSPKRTVEYPRDAPLDWLEAYLIDKAG